VITAISVAASGGCGAAGWYRSLGHFPGISPTDYAFSFYCGTAAQLYQFSPPQVGTSAMEALGDLGFRISGPAIGPQDGERVIRALTPDGRPATITIAPQNAMTNVKVLIGPDHLGDYELSRDLLRRIAVNFGTGMRVYTPVETTLPRRLNLSLGVPPRTRPAPPEEIKGEGLRPEEKRAGATEEDQGVAPESEGAPALNVPGALRSFIPTRSFPNPSNMPYAPWPYTPFNYDLYQY
jgi:hypothetical protein